MLINKTGFTTIFSSKKFLLLLLQSFENRSATATRATGRRRASEPSLREHMVVRKEKHTRRRKGARGERAKRERRANESRKQVSRRRRARGEREQKCSVHSTVFRPQSRKMSTQRADRERERERELERARGSVFFVLF